MVKYFPALVKVVLQCQRADVSIGTRCCCVIRNFKATGPLGEEHETLGFDLSVSDQDGYRQPHPAPLFDHTVFIQMLGSQRTP
jgi:hypothetical protein